MKEYLYLIKFYFFSYFIALKKERMWRLPLPLPWKHDNTSEELQYLVSLTLYIAFQSMVIMDAMEDLRLKHFLYNKKRCVSVCLFVCMYILFKDLNGWFSYDKTWYTQS